MELDPQAITSLPLQQFRRFGIACCRRLGCANKDRRLAKALKKLEQSLGPPINERMRRDALNTAKSAYQDIRSKDLDMTINAAVACTLVCACEDGPNVNLLGNFEFALSRAEALSVSEIREIECSILNQIVVSKRDAR